MVQFCNGALCRTRPHGVGDGGGKFPVIETITKLDMDPPIWFVQVEGLGRMELTTEQLQRYDQFHRIAMNNRSHVYV